MNIVRFIPQIAQCAYATRGDAAYVNLFVASDAKLALSDGTVTLSQETDYPWKGASKITVADIEPRNSKPETRNQKPETRNFTLNVRVPGWCVGRPVPSDLYTQTTPGSLADFSVKVNGKVFAFTPEKGYCAISREWKKGDVVEVAMNMPVRRPILYCAEGVDNDGRVLDKSIAADAKFTPATCNILGNVYPAFTVQAASVRRGLRSSRVENAVLKLVPYFAWCHRGAGEMQTWFPVAPQVDSASFDFKLSASFCYPRDSISAACDGVLPKASNDESIPRHTFWDHKGTAEWVMCEFSQVEELKGVSVYWFDDGKNGNCRLPASWKARRQRGSTWGSRCRSTIP